MQIHFGAQRAAQPVAVRFGVAQETDTRWQRKLDLDMRRAYARYQANLDDREFVVLVVAQDLAAAQQKLKEQGLHFEIALDNPPVLTGALRMSKLEAVARLDEIDNIEKSPGPDALKGPHFGDTFHRV